MTRGAEAVLPGPCVACGGEVVLSARPDPASLLRQCADCGQASSTPLEPAPEARAVLERVLSARDRLRTWLRPARPVILLWLPPGEARHHVYQDTAALAAERLAADDPSIWLRTEPYPASPEDESVALSALADVSILVAPGRSATLRALTLLGDAIPAARALVLATGLEGSERESLGHPRLRPLEAPEDRPGGLFDALSDALVKIRRVAWWRALDPAAAPGDPLTAHDAHRAAVAVAVDDLCAYLLRLADRSVPARPDRLLEEAGDCPEMRERLQALREAGALEVIRERVHLTGAGRALLGRLLPGVPGGPARSPSTLARLFDEARSGNQDALGRLLKSGGEQARIVARRRLGPALRAKVDSVDISQSVIVDLMKGLDQFEFRGEPQWRGYLRRLVENKIRAKADYFGAARRDLRRERSLETRGRAEGARATEPPAGTPSPSELLLREEEIGRIEKALEQMPAAERDVVVLRVFEGLSHREIAKRLGRQSENAVHKLYGRALERLAGLLGRSV